MYGWDILCGISKGTFEITLKISYAYIERYDFFYNIGNLRAQNIRAHTFFEIPLRPHRDWDWCQYRLHPKIYTYIHIYIHTCTVLLWFVSLRLYHPFSGQTCHIFTLVLQDCVIGTSVTPWFPNVSDKILKIWVKISHDFTRSNDINKTKKNTLHGIFCNTSDHILTQFYCK